MSNRVADLINRSVEIDEQDAKSAGMLGFMARPLVQATMPYKNSSNDRHERTNGRYTLSMVAGNSAIGLPYGNIPRLVTIWLASEAVKTQERELILGNSLSGFMCQLGIVRSGGKWGSVGRLREQLRRLFNCQISVYSSDSGDHSLDLTIRKESHLWWDPKDPNQQSLFPSTVLLAEGFFEEVTRSPIPIDMRAIMDLKSSPMSLDIYMWLTWRMSYLTERTEIPWQLLAEQFGGNYAETRFFKRAFLIHLEKVRAVYPAARVTEGKNGLILQNSPTHVPQIRSYRKNGIIN